MKTRVWLWIAIASTLFAVGIHYYLASRHVALLFGSASTESVCNISSVLNCDAVNTSRFSKLFGLSMASWGFAANLTLLLMLFSQFVSVSFLAFGLASFIALTSIVMAGLSSTLSAFCLFCIFTYLLSFISFESLRRFYGENLSWTSFSNDLKALSEKKTQGFLLLLIPASAWFLDSYLSDQFGGKERLRLQVIDSVRDWRQNPSFDFSKSDGLSMGGEQSPVVMDIVEFADFRCHHCRNAAPTLHTFTQSRKDVKLTFLAFPLDGECNKALDRGDGVSCLLAKAVYCAGQRGKGWELHHRVFDAQEKFLKIGTKEAASELLGELTEGIASKAEIDACINASETVAAVERMALQGKNANIKGTPSVFVNGRYLPGGQIMAVLERAYEEIKSSKP